MSSGLHQHTPDKFKQYNPKTMTGNFGWRNYRYGGEGRGKSVFAKLLEKQGMEGMKESFAEYWESMNIPLFYRAGEWYIDILSNGVDGMFRRGSRPSISDIEKELRANKAYLHVSPDDLKSNRTPLAPLEAATRWVKWIADEDRESFIQDFPSRERKISIITAIFCACRFDRDTWNSSLTTNLFPQTRWFEEFRQIYFHRQENSTPLKRKEDQVPEPRSKRVKLNVRWVERGKDERINFESCGDYESTIVVAECGFDSNKTADTAPIRQIPDLTEEGEEESDGGSSRMSISSSLTSLDSLEDGDTNNSTSKLVIPASRNTPGLDAARKLSPGRSLPHLPDSPHQPQQTPLMSAEPGSHHGACLAHNTKCPDSLQVETETSFSQPIDEEHEDNNPDSQLQKQVSRKPEDGTQAVSKEERADVGDQDMSEETEEEILEETGEDCKTNIGEDEEAFEEELISPASLADVTRKFIRRYDKLLKEIVRRDLDQVRRESLLVRKYKRELAVKDEEMARLEQIVELLKDEKAQISRLEVEAQSKIVEMSAVLAENETRASRQDSILVNRDERIIQLECEVREGTEVAERTAEELKKSEKKNEILCKENEMLRKEKEEGLAEQFKGVLHKMLKDNSGPHPD